MEKSDLKARISILWILMAVALSAEAILMFIEPGNIEEMMTGVFEGSEINEGILFLLSLFWFIPLWMAFLTRTLKDKTNRWVNIILGLVFVVLNLIHFADHVIEPHAYQLLLVGSTVVAAFLIFWHAWKWQIQKA